MRSCVLACRTHLAVESLEVVRFSFLWAKSEPLLYPDRQKDWSRPMAWESRLKAPQRVLEWGSAHGQRTVSGLAPGTVLVVGLAELVAGPEVALRAWGRDR